jgi:hypothetical protein
VVVAISTTTAQGGFGLDLHPDPLITDLGQYAICGRPRGSAMQATRLASATGGIHLQQISPTDIAIAITSAVQNVVVGVDQVDLVPAGAAASFLTDLSRGPAGPLSANGLTVTFNVEFEGTEQCAKEP